MTAGGRGEGDGRKKGSEEGKCINKGRGVTREREKDLDYTYEKTARGFYSDGYRKKRIRSFCSSNHSL